MVKSFTTQGKKPLGIGNSSMCSGVMVLSDHTGTVSRNLITIHSSTFRTRRRSSASHHRHMHFQTDRRSCLDNAPDIRAGVLRTWPVFYVGFHQPLTSIQSMLGPRSALCVIDKCTEGTGTFGWMPSATRRHRETQELSNLALRCRYPSDSRPWVLAPRLRVQRRIGFRMCLCSSQ